MAMIYKHGGGNSRSSIINCSECRYIRVDKEQSTKSWTAYVCGNRGSEYHKALLNVTLSGEKQTHVSWGGCEWGVAKGGSGV